MGYILAAVGVLMTLTAAQLYKVCRKSKHQKIHTLFTYQYCLYFFHQPFPHYSTGRYWSCKNHIDRVSEPTRSLQLYCKQGIFVFFDQSCLRDCTVSPPFHNCFACVFLSVFYFFSPKFIFIIPSVFPSFLKTTTIGSPFNNLFS